MQLHISTHVGGGGGGYTSVQLHISTQEGSGGGVQVCNFTSDCRALCTFRNWLVTKVYRQLPRRHNDFHICQRLQLLQQYKISTAWK